MPILNECLPNNIPDRKIVQRVLKRKRETGSVSRKKLKNEKAWVDNMAKIARSKGIEGMGRKGPIKAKTMKPGCDTSCRSKCSENISEEDRLMAFNEFRNLGSTTNQWQCIINWTSFKSKKELDDESQEVAKIYNKISKKNPNLDFTLPSTNGPVSVCRTMFLNTLGKYQLIYF